MRHNPKRETMTTDQPGPPKDAVVERFPPTSGRVAGVVGLVTAGVVLTLAIVPLGRRYAARRGDRRRASARCSSWAALLRPALWVTARRPGAAQHAAAPYRIPLAAIDRVVVTQVLAVSARRAVATSRR